MPIYEKLRDSASIRLLRLAPGQYEQPVVCDLVETTLGDTELTYEAISYTWGNPADQRTITCNNKSIAIGYNAHRALRTLRRAHEYRLLWLDSICINQGDIAERERQVSIMRLIYQRARCVVICLGDLVDKYQPALIFVSSIDAATGMHGLKEFMAPVPSASRSPPKGASALTPELIRSIEHLLSHPWFIRVWIQQEAVVNENTIAICGAYTITISQLCALGWLMVWQAHQPGGHLISNDTNNAARCILSFWKNREAQKSPEDRPDLLTVLYNSIRCQATDSRDFIYALSHLGWDKDLQKWIPKANYTMSPSEVYTNFSMNYINRGDYHILQYAGRCNQTDPNLPSWAPEWSNSFSLFFPPSSRNSWHAGGKSAGFSGFSLGRRCVWTTELILNDILYFLGESFSTCRTIVAVRDAERRCSQAAKRFHTYCTGESTEVAYWKTMTAGVEHLVVQGSKSSFQLFGEWQRWLASPPSSSCDAKEEKDEEVPFFQGLLNASRSFGKWKYCATQHGLMCLVPPAALPTDHICIIKGHSMPVVLRRLPTGPLLTIPTPSHMPSPQYEMVGNCYVHGLMNGETTSLMEGTSTCTGTSLSAPPPPPPPQSTALTDATSQHAPPIRLTAGASRHLTHGSVISDMTDSETAAAPLPAEYSSIEPVLVRELIDLL